MISIGRRVPAASDLVGHLLECHERIRRFVALAVKVGAGGGAAGEVVDACAAVERYFERALPLHIEDEERSIVARLRGKDADVDEALRAMEAEHEAHRPLVEELLAASRSVRESPDATDRRERLRLAAVRLAADFEPHLAREERVVFPAVRSLLDADAHAQIRGEQRARRERSGFTVP